MLLQYIKVHNFGKLLIPKLRCSHLQNERVNPELSLGDFSTLNHYDFIFLPSSHTYTYEWHTSLFSYPLKWMIDEAIFKTPKLLNLV